MQIMCYGGHLPRGEVSLGTDIPDLDDLQWIGVPLLKLYTYLILLNINH